MSPTLVIVESYIGETAKDSHSTFSAVQLLRRQFACLTHLHVQAITSEYEYSSY